MNTYKMSHINEHSKKYALGVWWPDPPTPTQHILECIVDDSTQDVYYYNDTVTTIKETPPIETTYPFTKKISIRTNYIFNAVRIKNKE